MKRIFYLFINPRNKHYKTSFSGLLLIISFISFQIVKLNYFEFSYSGNMSDQQQILPCVICNQHHQQMLMLSCLHDPCINCAAIHYVQNASKNSLYYPCSKCNQQTQLDSSSVVQLQRVYRTLKPVQPQDKKYQYNRTLSKGNQKDGKNSRTKLTPSNDHYQPYKSDKYQSNYRNQKISSYAPSVSHSPFTPSLYQNSKKNAHMNMTQNCSEHPQDQLSYFCFSCNKPICPQCAIHGSHKQHQVQTTRRAIKQIKGRLNEANQKLSTQIGHLMHKKQQGRKHLKDLADANKRDHDEIKRQFNRLRNLLVQKEKQFLNSMAQNYDRNCQQTKYYGTNIDKLIEGYNVVRKSIDVTLKRDDLSVLQQFNRRQQQANDILDRNSILSNQSRIKSSKQIDYQLFEDEISQLSGIMQSMRLTLTSNKNQY